MDKYLPYISIIAGIAFFIKVGVSINAGVLTGRWGSEYDRESEPFAFWGYSAVYAILGIMAIYVGIKLLTDPSAWNN